MKLSRGQMADMFAHAIIASAKVYGDDPIIAVMGDKKKPYGGRRSLAAACQAVRDRFRLTNRQAAAPVDLTPGSLSGLISARTGLHDKANAAAVAAVAKALAKVESNRPGAITFVAPGQTLHPPRLPTIASANPAKPIPVPRKAEATPTSSLGDRIFAELTKRPLSANSLATILDAKEMHVIGSMRALALEGAIVCISAGNESTAKWQAA